MTSGQQDERPAEASAVSKGYRVLAGDQMCPRCRKYFTFSYWNAETLIQARCLSCDLKWPRPDVV
jgi:Zn ribbon nucleic-acid-binding protein